MAIENQRLATFLAEVGARFRPQEPASFWDCEAAFRDLLATSFAVDALNQELRSLLERPDYQGNWLPKELILHRGSGTALTLSLASESKRYLHVLPYHAMYSALRDVEIPYDTYRVPESYRNDLFDPGLRLLPPTRKLLMPRDVLKLHCGEFAYDLKFSAPIPMVKFMTTTILPLEWLFLRESLQAWQANDADLSFTQLRVASDVLGKIAHQSSVPALSMLTEHPHHAVRWSAIQNLGRISKSVAIEKLRGATKDPHPHVRNAALKTLNAIEGQGHGH